MIGVRAVNVATPAVLATQDDEPVWSAIAKAPIDASATMWLSLLNLAGDGQADLTVHGGVDKAVYAYPSASPSNSDSKDMPDDGAPARAMTDVELPESHESGVWLSA